MLPCSRRSGVPYATRISSTVARSVAASTLLARTPHTRRRRLRTDTAHGACGQAAFHVGHRVMVPSVMNESVAAASGANGDVCVDVGTGVKTHCRQRLSVAPMMDWTDLPFRQMARLISRRTVLYTEMVVDKTVIHTDKPDKFLWFPPEQHPIVCQLGGSNPESLAQAVARIAPYGYDEINLNCGCPSDRVAGAGCFGATLMLQPELVAQCCAAMAAASGGIPISVKCRLGVDDVDSYEALCKFVSTVASGSPVRHFILHARKCFLKGLSPAENRDVPPLRHEWVYALKRDFPHLTVSLNGGVMSSYEAAAVADFVGPWPSCTERTEVGAANKQAGQGSEAKPAHDPAEGGPCLESVSQPGVINSGRVSEVASFSAGHAAGTISGDSSISVPEPKHPTCASSSASAGGNVQQDSGAEPGDSLGSSGAATTSASAPKQTLLEGVMIGRAAYNDPWHCLGPADAAMFGEAHNAAANRREVLERYAAFADGMLGRWGKKGNGQSDPSVRTLAKPLLMLFYAEPGSKRWKAAVDAELKKGLPSVSALLAATIHLIPAHVLDAPPPGPSSECTPRGTGKLPTPSDMAGGNQPLAVLKRKAQARDGAPQASKKARKIEHDKLATDGSQGLAGAGLKS